MHQPLLYHPVTSTHKDKMW